MDSGLQSLIVYAALALLGVGLIGFATIGGRAALTTYRRRARLAAGGGGPAPSNASLVAGAMTQLTQGVRKLGGKVEEKEKDLEAQSALRMKLVQAGFTSRDAVAIYLGARAIVLGVAIGLTLIVLPWAAGGGGGPLSIIVAGVLAVAAILGPDQVLKSRKSRREREYREGFPDMLDLMVASVQAGLSLDAAVGRIMNELISRYPNLAEHMRAMTLELRAGRSRKEAWSRFGDRLGIDEARSFATMLRQAEEMGVSLGETLAVFSDDMRNKRMMRAEEKAMALPAKLMLPLILFIFPCLLGALILPAAVHVAQVLKHH
jgi:tight adherence protein C